MTEVPFDIFVGPLFIPTIAFAYIFSKQLFRSLIHAVAEVQIGFWQSICWFGVEIFVADASLSIGFNVPGRLAYNYSKITFWYFFLVVGLVFSSFVYGLYLRRFVTSDIPSNIWHYVIQGFLLSLSWFWGICYLIKIGNCFICTGV